MNIRQELEKLVISAVIFDDAFSNVASILQAKNFTTENYSKIFAAASKLYPTKPVNLISLYNQFKVSEPDFLDALAHEIILLESKLVGCNQIRYNCLLILQLDIENSYRNDLMNWRNQRIAGEQSVEVAVLTEMIELLIAPGVDILSFIDKALVYFDMQNMTPEYEATKQFNIDIAQKVRGINRTITIDTALSSVYRIVDSAHDVRLTCNRFIDAISSMIITNEIKPNYLQAAELLS